MSEGFLINSARLRALEQSRLLDTPPELVFDRITRDICLALDVPISVISLISPDRQFFKSQQGLGAGICEGPIRYSICQYVVELGSTLVINNSKISFGLRDHPAVVEDNITAYLGAPFVFNGHILGSVCAADKKAREWGQDDIKFIEAKALQAKEELICRNDGFNLILGS